MTKQNPLLDFSGLPRFAEIRPEHVEPALDTILAENRRRLEGLLDDVTEPGWENFIAPLDELDDRLERMWSPVSHLNAVRDSEELRAAYQACLPKLTDYYTELGQNERLFGQFKRIGEQADFHAASPARRKYIGDSLRDFHLAGVDLAPRAKARFGEISRELSKLGNRFEQNLLDATDGWQLHLTEEADLAGLPDTVRDVARQAAEQSGLAGWKFTLQAPSYIPFLTYADSRDLRERMYRAFVTRASETGPDGGRWDNSEVMPEILCLRRELAALLDFSDYADYSLATKMARSADEVEKFLLELAGRSLPAARRDLQELEAFAGEHYGVENLAAWDIAWYSEKLRQHRFDFSQEDLRPYFPLQRVLEGLFNVVHELFGITVQHAEPPQVWDGSVGFYAIRDGAGELRGQFYVDLYAREHKRGGAWMADCVGRRRTAEGVQLPVAFLTCNFTPSVGDKPALLTHDEVITLFHEFGHGLHHMLTLVDVPGVAGINGVAWDAVELPSQFLENWCWEREALDVISGHFETGEPLPDDLLRKMLAARNLQAGMQMCRQIEFSLFDIRLHGAFDPDGGQSIQQLLDEVRQEVAVLTPPDFNRFQNGFSHIFAGGYAAGYYSYKWAEVLSADAFGRFEEEGVFSPAAGDDFLRQILEKGGSQEPMELFVAFRGREPSIEPLLRHSGLGDNLQAT
ncbi:MAG: M3 family metallopeptidase [Pseudomonadota bacterium]|nr:M3 family metallopeptidase [Pseudomonadota bacterium]